MPNKLRVFRKQIQGIDLQIIKQISSRLGLVKKVGKFKKKSGYAIHDPAYENFLMNYYIKLSIRYGLPQKAVLKLFQQIINLSKCIQTNVRT